MWQIWGRPVLRSGFRMNSPMKIGRVVSSDALVEHSVSESAGSMELVGYTCGRQGATGTRLRCGECRGRMGHRNEDLQGMRGPAGSIPRRSRDGGGGSLPLLPRAGPDFNPADPADPALTSLRVGYCHDCNKRFIRSASLECWPAALWYPSSDMDNGAKDIPVFIALMLGDFRPGGCYSLRFYSTSGT